MDKRQEAIRLRDQEKLTFKAIALRLGVSTATVYCWTKPEYEERHLAGSRAWKERNREANRARDRKYVDRPENRGRCDSCGGLRGVHSGRRQDGGLCLTCVIARKEERWRAIQSMWAAGRTCREIAEALDRSRGYVASEMWRMRDAGWDLAHRYQTGVAA